MAGSDLLEATEPIPEVYPSRSIVLHRWLIVVLVVAGATCAAADDRQALIALLEQAHVELEMPGLRAAVRLPNGRIVRASVGLADVEAGIPLNDTVGMPGGSTGKTFVAALTMLLVEDGALTLADPAAQWLGETRWYDKVPHASRIRVRHLLSHSSGVADYPGFRFQAAMVWRALTRGSAKFTPEELIRYASRKRPLFTPGSGFAYSDAGYLILGRIIGASTSRDYFDLLEERILSPLQLNEIRPQTQSALADISPGYTMGARNLKKDGRMKFDPTSEWTGGGLVTNPTMLVEFFGALAEGRVVSPESLTQMLRPIWQPSGSQDNYYGLGLFVRDGGRSFGHGGMWPGYRTHVTHFSRTGITVAVQTNRDGRLNMEALLDEVYELFVRE